MEGLAPHSLNRPFREKKMRQVKGGSTCRFKRVKTDMTRFGLYHLHYAISICILIELAACNRREDRHQARRKNEPAKPQVRIRGETSRHGNWRPHLASSHPRTGLLTSGVPPTPWRRSKIHQHSSGHPIYWLHGCRPNVVMISVIEKP